MPLTPFDPFAEPQWIKITFSAIRLQYRHVTEKTGLRGVPSPLSACHTGGLPCVTLPSPPHHCWVSCSLFLGLLLAVPTEHMLRQNQKSSNTADNRRVSTQNALARAVARRGMFMFIQTYKRRITGLPPSAPAASSAKASWLARLRRSRNPKKRDTGWAGRFTPKSWTQAVQPSGPGRGA